jgi:hypothetical protein
MSTLQVTTITTVNNTTPLILATGNTGGGQIVLQAANNDVQFTGNMRLTANIVGDGSGLTLPSSNVANAAFGRANTALANTSGVWFGGNLSVSGTFGIGTSTAYGKFNVVGGRSFQIANNEVYALGLGYHSSTGGYYYLGASNSATPDLIFSQVGGSERMRLTNDGNLGIGTATPSYKLHVNGTTGFSNGDVTVSNNYGLGWGGNAQIIGSGSSQYLRFDVGGPQRLYMDGSGNTSMNTTLSWARHHIALTNQTRNSTLMNAGNTNPLLVLSAPFSNPENTTNAGAKWGMIFSGNGDFPGSLSSVKSAGIFAVSEDGSAGYNRKVGLALHACSSDGSHIERVRVDGDGNVGIGTTSPIAYNSSGKVITIAGTSITNPSTIIQMGNKDNPGRGYSADETFFVSGVGSATEISRITASSQNGIGMYFKVKVVGHSASTGSGLNIKEYYYDGSTVTQVGTATAGSVPPITTSVPSSGVVVVSLASANPAVGNFNGVMRIEWMAPVDFSSANWTIS